MLRGVYRNYWRFGFSSRLYDFLTPWSYLDSLDSCVRALDLQEGERVLDAGCGSGLGFLAVTNTMSKVRYFGMDILESGLNAGRAKAEKMYRPVQTFWVRSDLEHAVPFRDESFDKILAHFSIYTLAQKRQRLAAWKSLNQVMVPGGILATANPSTDYNSRRIIEESLKHPDLGNFRLKRLEKRIFYFFTERLGLRHIESRLRSGHWHAYSKGELEDELREAGFRVERSQEVYAGSGWMVVAAKP